MAKQTIWQWLVSALQQHKTAALFLVVDSKGSSPGKTGAKMAMILDKDSFGTIGGGKVEHDLNKYALKCLNNGEHEIHLFHKKHHSSSAFDTSGQVCGGEQTVVLVICQQCDLSLLQKIQLAEDSGQAIILEITPQGLNSIPCMENPAKSSFNYHHETDWRYQEVIGLRKCAYIIGGGHIGLALTHMLVLLDYDVTVIDQRTAVKTMEDNALASQKRIIPYTEIGNEVVDGLQSYVFVMTHSHETDQQVVELLGGRNFKYFGVLGSRRKIGLMKKNLNGKISERSWQSIHAPIGLPIKSQTPVEIAVSIAAELIQFDNA